MAPACTPARVPLRAFPCAPAQPSPPPPASGTHAPRCGDFSGSIMFTCALAWSGAVHVFGAGGRACDTRGTGARFSLFRAIPVYAAAFHVIRGTGVTRISRTPGLGSSGAYNGGLHVGSNSSLRVMPHVPWHEARRPLGEALTLLPPSISQSRPTPTPSVRTPLPMRRVLRASPRTRVGVGVPPARPRAAPYAHRAQHTRTEYPRKAARGSRTGA